jgi:branched-chain amino acid transport system ATP-binding protein
MTVAENLEMGAFQRSNRGGIKGGHGARLRALPAARGRTQKAGTLSGGEQQMCAIGRAMMAVQKLLMLDEPSMGLAPMFVRANLRDDRGDQPAGNSDLLSSSKTR